MALTIQVQEKAPGAFMVRLAGRLDTAAAAEFEAKLAPVLQTATTVVLDMANLEYICSTGLRVILGARKILQKRRGRVVMAMLQPQIQKVFDVSEILPQTDIFDSMESADIFLDAIQRKEIIKGMDVDN